MFERSGCAECVGETGLNVGSCAGLTHAACRVPSAESVGFVPLRLLQQGQCCTLAMCVVTCVSASISAAEHARDQQAACNHYVINAHTLESVHEIGRPRHAICNQSATILRAIVLQLISDLSYFDSVFSGMTDPTDGSAALPHATLNDTPRAGWRAPHLFLRRQRRSPTPHCQVTSPRMGHPCRRVPSAEHR